MKLAVVALVLAACSSQPKTIAARDLEAAFEQAECEYQARCGFFPDVATCNAAYTGFHFAIDASVIAEIDAKKVTYDGAAASECIDSYAKATCDSTDKAGRTTPTACDRIFRGTVGDGGTCVNGHECLSQVCTIPVCLVECCAGTCTGGDRPVRAKVGQPCTLLPCEDGSYCDINSNTCTPLLAQGAACIAGFQCAYGLGCAGSPMQCKALPAVGEACPDRQCRDDGVVCTAGTCVRLGLPGDACTTDGDCSHFYGCAPNKTCAIRDPGGVCSSSSDCFEANTFCAIPNGATTGTCAPAQANGAVCSDDRDCASDTCDDHNTPMTCIDESICI